MYGKFIDAKTDFNGKYILFEPTSALPSKVVYDTKSDAIKTSYILAAKHPGKKFLVLRVEGETVVSTPVYSEY